MISEHGHKYINADTEAVKLNLDTSKYMDDVCRRKKLHHVLLKPATIT